MAGKQIGGQQFIRPHVRRNAPFAHEHNAVHAAPEHILKPVLDDDDGRARLFLNLVDQLDGLLAGGRVKVGQRLVKQQHLHLIHHHARQTHALLLAAGELMRRVLKVALHAHQLCHAVDRLLHVVLRHAVVFQREGDILAHGQADELPVRILKHGAHMCGQLKHARLGRIHAVHRQAAPDLAREV